MKRVWKKVFIVTIPGVVVYFFMPVHVRPLYAWLVVICGLLWIVCTEMEVDE